MAAKILIQGSVVRAAYGLFALLAPKVLFRSVGLSYAEVDPDARYFNRMFGGRDLLVAGATFAAARSGAERQATNANLICEATDSISLLAELRERGGMDRTLAIAIAFNVAGYATWLRALSTL